MAWLPVPRLRGRNGAQALGTELAQLDAELVNGERMAVAMLVGVLDIAGVQHLADDISLANRPRRCRVGSRRQTVVPVSDEAFGADQLLFVQPFGVRWVAMVETG